MILKILRYLIDLQARWLAFLRPAQLLGFLNRNRAHAFWTVRLPKSNDLRRRTTDGRVAIVLEALSKAGATTGATGSTTATSPTLQGHNATTDGTMANGNGHGDAVSPAGVSGDGKGVSAVGGAAGRGRYIILHAKVKGETEEEVMGTFKALYKTPVFKWVDAIDFTLLPTRGDAVIVECWSRSSSVVPALWPFAPIIALWLFWLPFDDHYQNFAHLLDLKELLEAQGMTVEEDVRIRGSCIFGFDGKMRERSAHVDSEQERPAGTVSHAKSQ